MGWNLGGIVAGAIAGAAGAAERFLVEERRNETALAKEKELAQFRADIEMEKQQRLEELKIKRKDAWDAQERESIAENIKQAGESAKEAGFKPGTVEYHTHAAEFLNASGRAELAKEQLAEANRIRTDDTKDQIAAAKNETALARLEAASARRAAGGKDKDEDEDKLDDRNMKRLITMGTKTLPKKDGNGTIKDSGAGDVFVEQYNGLRMKGFSPQQAMQAISPVVAATSGMLGANKGISGYDAATKATNEVRRAAAERMMNAGNESAARGAGIISGIQESIPRSPSLGSGQGSFRSADRLPLPGSSPAPLVQVPDTTASGGSRGRGALPGQYKGDLYITDSQGRKVLVPSAK
jgi:hypothetical protein